MNANTDFKTIVRMREEAMHERDSLLYDARQEGLEQGGTEGIAEEQKKTVAFMRSQGIPEEIIQNYIAQANQKT